MDDNTGVFGAIAAYAAATGVFWLLFRLNSAHHWMSSRHFLATSISIGMAMCAGAVLFALLRRRAGK